MNLNKIGQLGVLIALPLIVLEGLRYVFREDWMESFWFVTVVTAICIGIYFVYVYIEDMTDRPWAFRFRDTFLSLAVTLVMVVLFKILIHTYLDKEYRIYRTDNYMSRTERKLQEIERKQGIEIDRSNIKDERQKLLNSYTAISLIQSLPVGFLFIAVISGLLSVVARRYT